MRTQRQIIDDIISKIELGEKINNNINAAKKKCKEAWLIYCENPNNSTKERWRGLQDEIKIVNYIPIEKYEFELEQLIKNN